MFEAFVDELQREFGLPDAPEGSSRLHEDLGMDSLAIFMLVVLIEERAAAPQPLAELPPLRTVQDAYDLYRQLVGPTL